MTRVYAIHTGSYSDQSWGPVFSTAEKALAYVKAYFNEDDNIIETHVLDDENDTGPVYPSWNIVFDQDGEMLYLEKFNEDNIFEPLLHKHECLIIPQKDCHWWILDRLDSSERIRAHLWIRNLYASDKDHAIKIAADARAQFLALR